MMCALKVLMKEYREGHCFFVELEKPLGAKRSVAMHKDKNQCFFSHSPLR